MAIVKVPENREVEMISEFCKNKMFTYEGIDISDKKGIKKLEKALRENGYNRPNFLAYWFTGEVMNRLFGLTESNLYPDDLTFLVIPDYYNAEVKVKSKARWFDDIIANNSIKQNGIDFGTEPDFDCLYEED